MVDSGRQHRSERHVVLVGLMATGKSTVGAIVADALSWPFIDLDAEIEVAAGRTVREIWATEGEEAFRRLETAALSAALDTAEPSVIAGGGGVVLAEGNRRRLCEPDSFVVWLRAGSAALAARIDRAEMAHRPLLDDDPAGKLEAMATDRTPLYEHVADTVIDVDDVAVDAVARAVLGAIDAQVTP